MLKPARVLWAGMLLAVLGVVAFATAWIVAAPHPRFSEADAAMLGQPGNAERGRLVFAAGNCASCHASPGQSDRLHLGGGLVLASMFGTFRVPNISPDPVDGIGAWSTIDLANALLSGVSPDGKHYYPVLPYTSFAHMCVEDIRDLMAYLRTLPPVSGRPPPHELSFPFTIRRFIGLWKLVYLDETPISPDAGADPAWSRGRYLVEAVSHCAECHSARNIFVAIKPDTRFAGGRNPEGVGFTPNITSQRIGDWSKEEIVGVLTTGRTPRHDSVGASMADVVTNTAMLPLSDREAIATYIKSLPPRPTSSP